MFWLISFFQEFSEPVYPSINEVLRLGGPYPQTIRSSFNDFWFKGFHDQSPFSWVGDKLLEAVSNQELPKLEEECEEITYRKHFIGKVNRMLKFLTIAG